MELKFQIDANPKLDLSDPEERRTAAQSCLASANEFTSFTTIVQSASKVAACLPAIGEALLFDAFAPTQVPMFVNQALAIELYLKGLLLKQSPDTRLTKKEVSRLMIHEIEDLFHAIDSNTQDAIFNLYRPQFSMPTREDFDLELKEHSKAFVCLRYSHEFKRFAVSSDFLTALQLALYEYVNKASIGR